MLKSEPCPMVNWTRGQDQVGSHVSNVTSLVYIQEDPTGQSKLLQPQGIDQPPVQLYLLKTDHISG